jgi:hypothetical protein
LSSEIFITDKNIFCRAPELRCRPSPPLLQVAPASAISMGFAADAFSNIQSAPLLPAAQALEALRNLN